MLHTSCFGRFATFDLDHAVNKHFSCLSSAHNATLHIERREKDFSPLGFILVNELIGLAGLSRVVKSH